MRRFVVGQGAGSALVVRRARPARQRGVVFLHGWRLVGRRAYRAWLDHIAAHGATVIAPRYQSRQEALPAAALANALAGVRSALRRFPVRAGGVTVVGHSAGGALAVDYAAVAASERVPPARAVLAIYPGRAIRGSAGGIPSQNLSQIPSATRLVAMASATDDVVGDGPAREIVAQATSIPPDRRFLLPVRSSRAADHFAPTQDTRAARAIFWRQLDRLMGL